MQPVAPLDELDRRIVAALLRDGRASWRRIAQVLGEQERTIARRGSRLLDEEIVRIQALPNPWRVHDEAAVLIRVRGGLRQVEEATQHLADLAATSWVTLLGDPVECIAEAYLQEHDILALVRGLESALSAPTPQIRVTRVLQYHRTVGGWSPDVLSPAQLQALREGEDSALFAVEGDPVDDPLMNAILTALNVDGRRSASELADELGVSRAKVGRRIDFAMSTSLVFVRAVVDPAWLGYPVEVVVEVESKPADLPRVAAAVAAVPEARWVADDGRVILAQLACRGRNGLHETIRGIAALPCVEGVHVSPFLDVAKRTTVRYRDGAPVPRS